MTVCLVRGVTLRACDRSFHALEDPACGKEPIDAPDAPVVAVFPRAGDEIANLLSQARRRRRGNGRADVLPADYEAALASSSEGERSELISAPGSLAARAPPEGRSGYGRIEVARLGRTVSVALHKAGTAVAAGGSRDTSRCRRSPTANPLAAVRSLNRVQISHDSNRASRTKKPPAFSREAFCR